MSKLIKTNIAPKKNCNMINDNSEKTETCWSFFFFFKAAQSNKEATQESSPRHVS